jgi:hypothetical protein
VAYVSKFLNIVERKYSTTEHEALSMVFVFHKFRNYLLGNKFVLYVDHMAFVVTLTSGLWLSVGCESTKVKRICVKVKHIFISGGECKRVNLMTPKSAFSFKKLHLCMSFEYS